MENNRNDSMSDMAKAVNNAFDGFSEAINKFAARMKGMDLMNNSKWPNGTMEKNKNPAEKTENKVELSPPWDSFATEVYLLFCQDPEIKYNYDHNEKIISLYVDNAEKADALTKILPSEKDFGGVKLKIRVIPANENEKTGIIGKAFRKNPVVSDIVVSEGSIVRFPVTYVMFQNKVVQFYDDNLADPNGFKSTLYENIAREVLDMRKIDDVCFCTDVPEEEKDDTDGDEVPY